MYCILLYVLYATPIFTHYLLRSVLYCTVHTVLYKPNSSIQPIHPLLQFNRIPFFFYVRFFHLKIKIEIKAKAGKSGCIVYVVWILVWFLLGVVAGSKSKSKSRSSRRRSGRSRRSSSRRRRRCKLVWFGLWYGLAFGLVWIGLVWLLVWNVNLWKTNMWKVNLWNVNLRLCLRLDENCKSVSPRLNPSRIWVWSRIWAWVWIPENLSAGTGKRRNSLKKMGGCGGCLELSR